MDPGSRLRVLLNTDSTVPVATPLKALHFSKIPVLFAKLELIRQRSDFTVGEAARAVGKNPRTIYNAIREGRLLAYKPERPFSSQSMDQWWIKPEELFKVWPKVRDVIPGLPSVALYVLIFQILTAARPAEVLGMRWEEWMEGIQVWRVPWQRVKQGGRTRQDHYVPLPPEATAILEMLREQQRRDDIKTEFVFGSYWTTTLTSATLGVPPARSTVRSLLEKNVEACDVDKTLHGMRRAFGSWARRLGFREEDIERGLSHIRGYGSTHVARLYGLDAYNDEGGDADVMSAFDEDPLRELFEAWAIYCLTGELPKGRVLRKPADVVLIPMRRPVK
jgi:integrase